MSNKKNLKNYGLLFSIFVYVLIFFLLIVKYIPNYSATITGVFTCLITFAAYACFGFQKYEINKLRKKIMIEVIVGVIIYFSLIYILGMFTGYLKSSYSLNILSIVKNMFIPLVSIIALEMFRYIFISTNRDSRAWVITSTVIIILLDIVINFVNIGPTLVQFFIYASTIVLPIIFKNIFLSYTSYQTGYHSCLLYVIPLCIYKFIVPLFPDIGNYLTCIVGITLPSMLFVYEARFISEFLNEKESKLKPIRVLLVDVPIVIIFTIFIGLISGFFTYHLIGVERSNISPTINRGDAVMLLRNLKEDDLKKGDIIAYRGEKEIIIDRIADVKEKDGEKEYYFVVEKNEGADDTYRTMNIDEIMGKYKFRIRNIAWPTIKFKEFIKGDVNEEQ